MLGNQKSLSLVSQKARHEISTLRKYFPDLQPSLHQTVKVNTTTPFNAPAINVVLQHPPVYGVIQSSEVLRLKFLDRCIVRMDFSRTATVPQTSQFSPNRIHTVDFRRGHYTQFYLVFWKARFKQWWSYQHEQKQLLESQLLLLRKPEP